MQPIGSKSSYEHFDTFDFYEDFFRLFKDEGFSTLKSYCSRPEVSEEISRNGNLYLQMTISKFRGNLVETGQVLECLIRAGADPTSYSWIDTGHGALNKSLFFVILQGYLQFQGPFGGYIDPSKESELIELIEIFHRKGEDVDQIIYYLPALAKICVCSFFHLAVESHCFVLAKKILELKPKHKLASSLNRENAYQFLENVRKLFQHSTDRVALLSELIGYGVPARLLIHGILYRSEEEEVEEQIKCLAILLETGVDINFDVKYISSYKTPLMVSFQNKLEKVCAFLVENNASFYSSKFRSKKLFTYPYPNSFSHKDIFALYAKKIASKEMLYLLLIRRRFLEANHPKHLLAKLDVNTLREIFSQLVKLHERELLSNMESL